MKIEKASRNDAKCLTELTIRSKSYWNYDKKHIEEWREELTITENYIEENQVYKFIKDDYLIGFYAYKPENRIDIRLDYFFVEPKFIGKGYGRVLMTDFFDRVSKTEYLRVVLNADPHAEKFYSRLSFRSVGKLKSSIKDRYLPIMEWEIKPIANGDIKMKLEF